MSLKFQSGQTDLLNDAIQLLKSKQKATVVIEDNASYSSITFTKDGESYSISGSKSHAIYKKFSGNGMAFGKVERNEWLGWFRFSLDTVLTKKNSGSFQVSGDVKVPQASSSKTAKEPEKKRKREESPKKSTKSDKSSKSPKKSAKSDKSSSKPKKYAWSDKTRMSELYKKKYDEYGKGLTAAEQRELDSLSKTIMEWDEYMKKKDESGREKELKKWRSGEHNITKNWTSDVEDFITSEKEWNKIIRQLKREEKEKGSNYLSDTERNILNAYKYYPDDKDFFDYVKKEFELKVPADEPRFITMQRLIFAPHFYVTTFYPPDPQEEEEQSDEE